MLPLKRADMIWLAEVDTVFVGDEEALGSCGSVISDSCCLSKALNDPVRTSRRSGFEVSEIVFRAIAGDSAAIAFRNSRVKS